MKKLTVNVYLRLICYLYLIIDILFKEYNFIQFSLYPTKFFACFVNAWLFNYHFENRISFWLMDIIKNSLNKICIFFGFILFLYLNDSFVNYLMFSYKFIVKCCLKWIGKWFLFSIIFLSFFFCFLFCIIFLSLFRFFSVIYSFLQIFRLLLKILWCYIFFHIFF